VNRYRWNDGYKPKAKSPFFEEDKLSLEFRGYELGELIINGRGLQQGGWMPIRQDLEVIPADAWVQPPDPNPNDLRPNEAVYLNNSFPVARHE